MLTLLRPRRLLFVLVNIYSLFEIQNGFNHVPCTRRVTSLDIGKVYVYLDS